jgi:hypothetical protein
MFGFGGGGNPVDPALNCLPISGESRRDSACDHKDSWDQCIVDPECFPASWRKYGKITKQKKKKLLTNLRHSFLPSNMKDTPSGQMTLRRAVQESTRAVAPEDSFNHFLNNYMK